MNASERSELNSHLDGILKELRLSILEVSNQYFIDKYGDLHDDGILEEGDIGVRVWLLPKFYYYLLANNHRAVRLIIDSLSMTFGIFKLYCVGRVLAEGDDNSSKWAIGRGINSISILSSVPIVDLDWSKKKQSIAQNRFKYSISADNPNRINHLRWRHIKKVREYGPVMSYGLHSDSEGITSYGCVTLHFTKRCSDTKEEAMDSVFSNLDSIVENFQIASTAISGKIKDQGKHYGLRDQLVNPPDRPSKSQQS